MDIDTVPSNDILYILLTEEQIKERVRAIGEQITGDYRDGELLVVGLLKGSVVFIADLIRSINLKMKMDFMSVSSYGEKTVSSGEVRIVKDLDMDVIGQDILVVEDILDSGLTLEYILDILKSRHPRSVRICALLTKPDRHRVNVRADYTGFVIPDEFVVGYGLDYRERYRNLPYIGVLKTKVYGK